MVEVLLLFAAVICLGIAAVMSPAWVLRLTLAAAALIVIAVWLSPALDAV